MTGFPFGNLTGRRTASRDGRPYHLGYKSAGFHELERIDMDEHEENFKDIFRYTDVEYTPDGYTDVYRWDDFLVIAGDHVYSAMDTIDSVSPGGEYEGFDPQYAYTCEIVGCGDLFDGCALFRPVSHDGEDYIQIAFLRSDIDDSTGEYTERFEAGSFDMPAADALRFDLAVDLMDYFSGRTFEGEPGVSRGLEPREAVAAVEGATGCDLNFFEDFWLGSPGEIVESVHVGPYTKQSLLDFSYYAKELSRRYGFADSDILEIARHLPEECPDRFAAVKAYLDCEYVPDGDAPDEKTYRWGDFLEIAGGDARYAAMLVDRTAAGEPEEGLHPETLVDQDIRDGEAFMLAGRPIAPEDAYDLPGTVHGLYKELVDNVDQSGVLFRDWRGFAAGTDADDVLRAIEAAFGETEYSRAGTVLGAYADDTFMSSFYVAVDDTRDVTPLTPWEDEDGVAFLSRTLDADAARPSPACGTACATGSRASRSAASSSTARKSASTRSPPRRPPTASTASSPISGNPPTALSRCAISPCAASMPRDARCGQTLRQPGRGHGDARRDHGMQGPGLRRRHAHLPRLGSATPRRRSSPRGRSR